MAITALNRALQAAGLHTSLEELRDILWLAAHISAQPVAAAAAVMPHEGADAAPTAEPAAAPAPPSPAAPAAEPSAQQPLPNAMYGDSGTGTGAAARRVQLRGAPALPQSLAIARALRPLSRRRAGSTPVLDERATAEFIADTQVKAAVWQPLRERWFDIVLAVEQVPSLAAWQPLVQALEQMLRRQGGFRSVSRLQLTAAASNASHALRASLPHSPEREVSRRALHDRHARRIVLVLSDCTSQAWRSGAMGDWLQVVGQGAPVAVLQLLPAALWPNTATGFAELRVMSPQFATPTAALRVRRPGWAAGDPGAVVPTVALEPAAVAAWARMVAAAGNAWSAAALLPLPDEELASEGVAAATELSPAQRAAIFRATATPDAQRLAAYFSVVRPLTPPVMRVIHRALAPASGPAALAQVFLGGLLTRAGPATAGAHADDTAYDFHGGVRELLQGGLTRREFVQVNLALHDYLQQESGTHFDFFALLEDPAGSARLPAAALPFVQMAREAAAHFSGAVATRPEPEPEPMPTPDVNATQTQAVAGLSITLSGSMLRYVLSSPRGQLTLTQPLPSGTDALLVLALEGSAANRFTDLARAVLPTAMLDAPAFDLGDLAIELLLDDATAAYPWELLLVANRPAAPGLALNHGLSRRPSRVQRPLATAATVRGTRAVVVADEPARAEPVRRVAELLAGVLGQHAVAALVQGDAAQLQQTLGTGADVRVLFVAGAGHLVTDASSPQSLRPGLARRVRVTVGSRNAIGLQEFEAMPSVPELVLLAASHGAALAPQLLSLGARAVVAPVGPVDDEAQAIFSTAFFTTLCSGQPLVQAVVAARQACQRQYPGLSDWAKFQCWGDTSWRLVDAEPAMAPAVGAPREAAAPTPPPPPAPRAALRPLPVLADCEVLAYISHARADDIAWFDWITHFRKELELGLAAQLRRIRLPRAHMAGDEGFVEGEITAALKRRIEKSWCLIIVVHDNYAQSEWCHRELEYFVELFGQAGVRERLHIVAMSEPAVQTLTRSPRWLRLFGDTAPLWTAFYAPDEPTRPVDIYTAPGLVAAAFREPFVRLRNTLADRLKASVAHAASAAMPSENPGAEPGQTRPRPRPVFGFVPPGLDGTVNDAVAKLARRGVVARVLAPVQKRMPDHFEEFKDATHLVLAFDDELLSPDSHTGGHLQYLVETWARYGQPAQAVLWLDGRDPVPPRRQWRGGAAYFAGLGLKALTPQDVLDRLAPWPEAASAAEAAADPGVRLYIERNRHERTTWEALGIALQPHWAELLQRTPALQAQPLPLRVRSLPVDQISFPSLHDADGVMLLWGRPPLDSLAARIASVEAKLPRVAGIPAVAVACLIPSPPAPDTAPVGGWPMLRFGVQVDASATILPSDVPQLEQFLARMLNQHRRRAGQGELELEPTEATTRRILISSSVELSEDRFQLMRALEQQAGDWRSQGLQVELRVWDDALDSGPSPSSRRERNQWLQDCDILVLLLLQRVGAGIEAKFDLAWQSRQATGRPAVLAYFKQAPVGDTTLTPDDLARWQALRRKFDTLGVPYAQYGQGEDLLRQVQAQIDTLMRPSTPAA